MTQSDTVRVQIPISNFLKESAPKMIEQLQENVSHEHNAHHGNEIKFESTMVFSKVVSCSSCGMEMQFVEKDVIFGENWYHGKCWQKTQEGKLDV